MTKLKEKLISIVGVALALLVFSVCMLLASFMIKLSCVLLEIL